MIRLLIWIAVIVGTGACNMSNNEQTTQNQANAIDTLKNNDIPFVVSLEEIQIGKTVPALQSAVVAQWNGKLLLWGGRKTGFHGRTDLPNQFNVKQTNDSIWVIDLKTQGSWGAPIPLAYRMPFLATNAAHHQEGQMLYVTGGYTVKDAKSRQNDVTSSLFLGVDVAAMIEAVIKRADPSKSILFSFSDARVQVTGGELLKIGDTFYLVMGQQYSSAYTPGKDGQYTDQVRVFNLQDSAGSKKIANYTTIQEARFHRRDLNVVPLLLNDKQSIGVYGGVFTKDDNGWTQPIYFVTDGTNLKPIFEDKYEQKTNQYSCATISIYDPATQAPTLKSMATCFLGGIGAYQYHIDTKNWEKGDSGIPLPFVKTISIAICSSEIDSPNRQAYEICQLPPQAPEMPDFLGANATFVLDKKWEYEAGIVDFSKLPMEKATAIGILYGGIKATAPTSSGESPTYVNQKWYQVNIERKATNVLKVQK